MRQQCEKNGRKSKRELMVDQITSLFFFCPVKDNQHQYWGRRSQRGCDWEGALSNFLRQNTHQCIVLERISSIPGKVRVWCQSVMFQGKPPEEQVFRCMGALSKFCSINREVTDYYHPQPTSHQPLWDEEITIICINEGVTLLTNI